jgi:hypothetical protein
LIGRSIRLTASLTYRVANARGEHNRGGPDSSGNNDKDNDRSSPVRAIKMSGLLATADLNSPGIPRWRNEDEMGNTRGLRVQMEGVAEEGSRAKDDDGQTKAPTRRGSEGHEEEPDNNTSETGFALMQRLASSQGLIPGFDFPAIEKIPKGTKSQRESLGRLTRFSKEASAQRRRQDGRKANKASGR